MTTEHRDAKVHWENNAGISSLVWISDKNLSIINKYPMSVYGIIGNTYTMDYKWKNSVLHTHTHSVYT